MTTVTNEATPYYEQGDDIPCSVNAGKAVIGKRFVKIAANMQGPPPDGLNEDVEGHNFVIENAGAGEKAPLGVAMFNQAEKRKVTVKTSPIIIPVKAKEAIKAGELVGCGAEGEAVKAVQASEAEIKEGKPSWKVYPVGLACADAAEGADCAVKLF
jgi:hypothetical protein